MITFHCKHCAKKFSVDDKLAGRKGKCKACGGVLLVPALESPLEDDIANWLEPPPSPVSSLSQPTARAVEKKTPPKLPKKKPPVRTRRLIADAKMLGKTLKDFPLIKIHAAEGKPPERYQLIYNVRGLVQSDNGPVFRDQHVVEIQLTRDYPRQSPLCRMLTPIFHPNIEPATICVGDHWTAGERLVDLVIRIGEMIAYQAYNIKSPLDGEAAMWADQNGQVLPVDRRDLHPPDLE